MMPEEATDGPTSDGLDPLDIYLESVRALPLLQADEEVRLARRYRYGRRARARLAAGGLSPRARARCQRLVAAAEEARRELIQRNLRLVISIARRYVEYTRAGMTLLDLIQEGNLGLMRAVEKFDHRKGFKFGTYATWWIRAGLVRALVRQSRTIRLPRRVAKQLRGLRRTEDQLAQELEREPTAADLAEAARAPVPVVEALLRADDPPVSLELVVSDKTKLGDLIADPLAVAPGSLSRELAQCIEEVIDELTPKELEVFKWRILAERPLVEVGQSIGVSRQRACQIQRQVLAKLRRALRSRERWC